MGKVGCGDEKIVAVLADDVRQVVVHGAGYEDPFGEPLIYLRAVLAAQAFDQLHCPLRAGFQESDAQLGKIFEQPRAENLLKGVEHVRAADDAFTQGMDMGLAVFVGRPRHALEHFADHRTRTVADMDRDR